MKAKILLIVVIVLGGGVVFLGLHEPGVSPSAAELHVKPDQFAN